MTTENKQTEKLTKIEMIKKINQSLTDLIVEFKEKVFSHEIIVVYLNDGLDNTAKVYDKDCFSGFEKYNRLSLQRFAYNNRYRKLTSLSKDRIIKLYEKSLERKNYSVSIWVNEEIKRFTLCN